MPTLEQILESGAENCHPNFIGEVDGKKTVVAREIDGVIYLTADGHKLFDEQEAAEEVKPKRQKRASKPEPDEVQSNVLADITDILEQ